MTLSERALLLAVAKHLYEPLCEKGEAEGYNLYCLTSAVEAEAVPEEPKLGEPCRSCTGHIRERRPMTTLKELAAMLDAAAGPAREIDNKIATVLDGWSASDVVGFYDLMHTHKPLPKYTSSIDAALALVERLLPGWAFNVCFRAAGDTTGDDAGWSVELRRPYEWLPFSTAPTAPLAILKALVAAMIAQEKTDD
jgi:hypothetical protein